MPLVLSSLITGVASLSDIKKEYQKMSPSKDFNGGGGLSSSPEDYGQFLACMLNKGTLNGVQVLEENGRWIGIDMMEFFDRIWPDYPKDFLLLHLNIKTNYQ